MKTVVIYTVLSVINLIGYVIGLSFLEDSVPVHFAWNGVVDEMGSPWRFAFVPVFTVVVAGFLWYDYLSPKNTEKKTSQTALVGVGVFLTYLGWLTFGLSCQGAQLGEKVSFPFAIAFIFPISALLMFVGNYMPKLKRNKYIGIKTITTLSSDYVWAKTNRLGGWLFFLSGFVSAVASVLFTCISQELEFIAIIVLVSAILLSMVVIVGYSHVVYKRENNAEQS